MKTTLKLTALALIAFSVGACSSSMRASRSGGQGVDDLYFNPKTSQTKEVAKQVQEPTKSSKKLADLERKYTEILANDSLKGIDSLVYMDSTSTNPYERVLADTYADAYERRQKGFASPSYGFNSLSIYSSDAYWHASAYDPAFYNIVVMGGEVWVEPRYVSAMFGYPYFRRGIYHNPWYNSYWGFGFGVGYYSPYYHWGYSNWYSPWNSYAWGFNDGFRYGYYNELHGSSNEYRIGRRPNMGLMDYGNRETTSNISINERRRDLSDRQATFQGSNESAGRVSRTRPGTSEGSMDNSNASMRPGRGENGVGTTRPSRGTGEGNISRSRPSRQDNTNKVAVTRPGRVDGVVEPVRDRNNSIVTRPSRESLNVNPTRTNPNGNTAATRPVREHNPSYNRPNSANSNEFNRTNRNYQPNRPNSNDRSVAPARSTRQPAREYNPPARTSVPSSSAPARSGSSGVSRESRPSVSSGRSSGNSSSSSSSRSSSSSSSSNSTTKSSSSGTRVR